MTLNPKEYRINHFSCQVVNNGFLVTIGFQNRANPDDVISEIWVHTNEIEARAAFEQWLHDVEAFQ